MVSYIYRGTQTLPFSGLCGVYFERERVCQQTAQHIPGEPGKQLSSLAPWVQNPAILWGRELIAPSAARGLLEGQALSAVLSGAQHTDHAGLSVSSRQQQALIGNLKCNFAVMAVALLKPQQFPVHHRSSQSPCVGYLPACSQ